MNAALNALRCTDIAAFKTMLERDPSLARKPQLVVEAARGSQLQAALAHIKTLQGILPICMHCKKIRDDQESWQRLEEYIQEHSDAQFSHGLCPECLEKYYPEPEADQGLAQQ